MRRLPTLPVRTALRPVLCLMPRAALLLGALGLSILIGARAPRADATAPNTPSAAPGVSAAVPHSPPIGKTGPFRVVVDRLSQSHSLSVNFRTPGNRRDAGAVQAHRSVNLQLGVFSDDPGVRPGFAVFQVKTITAFVGGRSVETPHFGGVLENPNDTALVRAYIYIPTFPSLATEIRAIEGELVTYDNSSIVEVPISLTSGLPQTVVKDGITFTVREVTAEGRSVQVHLEVQAPRSTAILSTTNDQCYGVTLLDRSGLGSMPGGGTFTQKHANEADYRVAFQDLKDQPGELHVAVLYRAGPRRIFPFRIEHIVLPTAP